MTAKPKESPLKVLLIDDEPDDRDFFKDMITSAVRNPTGFNVHACASLKSGIKALRQEQFDVILLDLNLTDSKGIETFHQLSGAAPEIPVVILSVLYDDELAVEAVRLGAQDYLFKKDVHQDALVKTLRFAVERQRLKKELDKTKTRLERLALMDPVTELFNRRGLEEILAHELQRSRKKHLDLVVMLVDLDDFRRINHNLGHNVGDVVLKEVAIRLRAVLRSSDYVGRVGGDEFMVLLPDTKQAEGLRLAEKLRLAVSGTMVSLSPSEDVKITATLGVVNIGVINVSESECSIHDLITRIREMLDKGKSTGKNRVAFHEESISGNPLEEIPRLLGESDKFYAVMQPIVHLGAGKGVGYEFLCRSFIKGFEMPEDFFRAALEANMMIKVDYHCLKACLNAAASLSSGMRAHINLLPSTMLSLPKKEFMGLFAGKHRKGSFCIEISEQQIIGEPSYLLEPVAALREAGVLIALDDLGFGRSCLESLILLEPDIVKIDKKCVTGAGRSHAQMQTLKRLLKMIRGIGAEAIAEGVENKQDLEMLKDLGVKFAQGFYLGRPMPVTEGGGEKLKASQP